MQIPKWTKPALWGAGAGAIALAVIGFSWGGWMTAGGATDMSSEQSNIAVAQALTPYCLQSAKSDPTFATIMVEFGGANSYRQRQMIEKAGWATPLGAEKPNGDLARTCQDVLLQDS